MICCDIKLNIVTRLHFRPKSGETINPFDILHQKLISSSKKKLFWSRRTNKHNISRAVKLSLGSTITNTSLRTHQFYFCLQRALGSTTTRLKFQFRVGALLKSPSNYLELIYEIDFLLELLQYHDKTFSFPRKYPFFPWVLLQNLNFLSKRITINNPIND